MKTRLEIYKSALLETFLNWLWGTWSLLGVPGSVQAQNIWALDPEALLLFSLPISRHDPRLFDEILNWLKTNGKLINIQRLKKMAEEEFQGKELLPVLGKIFSEYQHSLKWKNLFHLNMNSPPSPLFLDKDGNPSPLFGKSDPTFEQYGWLRGKWEFREHTSILPLYGAASSLLRLRALFGTSARAEIMLYLLTHDAGGHPSRIASETGYAQKTIQDTLVDMAQSGLIRVVTAGRRKDYLLRQQDFGHLPQLLGIPPRWINWSALLNALEKIWLKFSDKHFISLSPILAASELRHLTHQLIPHFASAETPDIFFKEPGALGEKYLDVFLSDLQQFLQAEGG